MSPFRGVGNAAEHRQDAIVLFDHRAPRDPQRLVHPWLPVSKGAFETVPHDLQRRPCLLSKFVHQLGLRLKLAEPAHVKKVLVAVLGRDRHRSVMANEQSRKAFGERFERGLVFLDLLCQRDGGHIVVIAFFELFSQFVIPSLHCGF